MVGAIVCCGCGYCCCCCCLNMLCDAGINVGDDGDSCSDSSYEDERSSSSERMVTRRVKQYWS